MVALRTPVATAVLAACACVLVRAQDTPQAPNPDSFYRLGPDSLEQEGVPKGEIRGPFTLPSTAYPGTQHTPQNWGDSNDPERHGIGSAILPEMMRWLWRDHPVSTDPRDTVERSMRTPAARP
jgi:hypothetical protein